MAEDVGRDRAEPLVKAMRASLTMRNDKTKAAVRVLSPAELGSLSVAAALLQSEVDAEIVRRGGIR